MQEIAKTVIMAALTLFVMGLIVAVVVRMAKTVRRMFRERKDSP